MHAPIVVAFAAIAAFAASALAQSAPPPAAATRASVDQPTASPATDYRFHTVLANTNGAPISLADFKSALQHGQRYVSHLDTAKHVMTLRLLAPGVATPDSFAPTDRQHLAFQWIERNGRHYSVEFHATNGTRIDQAAFVANAKQGQRYTQVLDSRAGAAVLTLLPLGANAPHSQPTARWVATRTPRAAG